MSISIISGIGPAETIPIASPTFQGRLSRLMAVEEDGTAGNVSTGDAIPESSATWTPQMLRAALVNLGASPSAENIALAQALIQFGLPLTAAAVTDANAALARAGKVSALSYAMARMLKLPPTPSILQALNAVTGGVPPGRGLPSDISDWLALALEGDMEPETMAAQLYLMIKQRGRSTENRLTYSAKGESGRVVDARTLLLRLAQGSTDKQIRKGADTLASHIEGQQLLNAAARRSGDDPEMPLYFAIPFRLAGEQIMLELSVWMWEEPQEDDSDDEPPEEFVRAVFRLEPNRLGPLQVEICGTLRGNMRCRIAAARQATVRLLRKNSDLLSGSLSTIGWSVCEVTCAFQDQWPPLWHGGDALTTPRTRVDWRA